MSWFNAQASKVIRLFLIVSLLNTPQMFHHDAVWETNATTNHPKAQNAMTNFRQKNIHCMQALKIFSMRLVSGPLQFLWLQFASSAFAAIKLLIIYMSVFNRILYPKSVIIFSSALLFYIDVQI